MTEIRNKNIETELHAQTEDSFTTQYASIFMMSYLSGIRENVTGNHIWR